MIYLAQTDTTVGFLSESRDELQKIKPRNNKPFLITTTTFKTLKNLARVPSIHKKIVRRAKKTTFIYPNNKAIRVIKDTPHTNFLKNFDFLYSTSANKSGKDFEESFARNIVDVVVEDKRGFSQKKASSLIKLSKSIKKKLR